MHLPLFHRTIMHPEEFLPNQVKTTHDLLGYCIALHFKHNDTLAHFGRTKDAIITEA